MFRQGDIELVPVDKLPELREVYDYAKGYDRATGYYAKKKQKFINERRKNGNLVIAEGEATGHHHQVKEPPKGTKILKHPENGRRWLYVPRAVNQVELVHDEHSAITLTPGYYEIMGQREFDPATRARRVYD